MGERMTENDLAREQYIGSGSPDAVIRLAVERLAEEALRARMAEDAKDAQIKALQDALLPFAKFAYHFNAAPLRGTDDAVYSIHGGEGVTEHGADIRLSDCRKALTVLAQMGGAQVSIGMAEAQDMIGLLESDKAALLEQVCQQRQMLTMALHMLEMYEEQASSVRVVMFTPDGVGMLQALIARLRKVLK